MTPSGVLALLITAPDAATAERVARGLVERKLAACVNVVPGIVSHYRWKGKLHRDAELLLIAKTTARLFDRAAAFVRGVHPAQVPEIIALPLKKGDKPYLRWLADSLR